MTQFDRDTFGNTSEGKINRLGIDINHTQEIIYTFFVEIIKYYHPEDVLMQFQKLFFETDAPLDQASVRKALYDLILANDELEFRNTLQRCCYILLNNWEINRQYETASKLLNRFEEFKAHKTTAINHFTIRQHNWLTNFVTSPNYEELKLFAQKYYKSKDGTIHHPHWSSRCRSYLLVDQYNNQDNPEEQRMIAKQLAQKLKQEFKFELAMFTVRSQSKSSQENSPPPNPTGLGEDVLRLIKIIVAKRGDFSFVNIAHIFLKQIQGLSYQDFKDSLKKYLVYAINQQVDIVHLLNNRLGKIIDSLYNNYDTSTVNDSLILRTCNRIFDYLTTENGRDPSHLFFILLSQGNPLTLVIILLKLLLISPNSRSHLEMRIGHLVRYYQDVPESDCQWVVNFFDIFNVTLAIYADQDVEYELISMDRNLSKDANYNNFWNNLDQYRIFSQIRPLSPHSPTTY